MAEVLVVLAEGFEELEAAAPVTILRRAQVEVTTAGLAPGPVRGARGLTVVPDTTLDAVAGRRFDAVLLPGGIRGTANLKASALVGRVLAEALERGSAVGAICAAPSVLAALGLLRGRRATSHADVRGELSRAEAVVVTDHSVVQDGKIVTSQGAGTAIDFGLHLVRLLCGPEKLAEVRAGMMLPARES